MTMQVERDQKQTEQTADESLPPKAVLLIIKGPNLGQRFSIEKQITIGRSSRCDISLPSQLVSRSHAEIIPAGKSYLLRDMSSANGTILNGKLIGESRLRHGDQICLGDVGMRFQIASIAAREDSSLSDVVMCQTVVEDRPRIRLHGQAGALQTSLFSKDIGRARRARERLDALVGVTENLARLRELDVVYPLVVDEVMKVLSAERCVLLRSGPDGELEPQVARNSKSPGQPVEVSRTVIDEVCTQRVCILSADALLDEKIGVSDSIMLQDIRSVLCVPIEHDKDLLGVLYLDAPGREGAFTEEDLHFVSGIAGVAAVAISNAVALEQVKTTAQELNHAYLSMLAVLANAIEARDHYTIGHTWRVARFSQTIARRLGWDDSKLKEVEVGGMLHDIGKIGVSDAILGKPGPLSSAEQELMKLHPQIGARMLRDVPSLRHVLPYVLYHHERFDGRGYPEGLSSDEIPIEARLLAVADTFDAMTSNRPYRKGLGHDVAIAELQRQAGAQCDPEIVQAFVEAYEAGDLTAYLQVGYLDPEGYVCPFCSTDCTPELTEINNGRTRCPVCNQRLRLSWSEDKTIVAELE
jgi:putative nucleotidyltransferase with HDIG domain